jgi:hypothetical protein
MTALVLVCLLAGGVDVAHAAEGAAVSWSLEQVVDGVSAWGTEQPGGFWGYARGQVDVPADVIFRRVSDFEALPKMYPWLEGVRVLERGESSALVYFHYGLPWPLSDRSFTAWHRWWRDDLGTIVLVVEDASPLGPSDDGAVHVQRIFARMSFTPQDGGTASEVDYLLRADVAGLLPRAVRAQTAWKIPLNAVLSMRRSLAPHVASR